MMPLDSYPVDLTLILLILSLRLHFVSPSCLRAVVVNSEISKPRPRKPSTRFLRICTENLNCTALTLEFPSLRFDPLFALS